MKLTRDQRTGNVLLMFSLIGIELVSWYRIWEALSVAHQVCVSYRKQEGLVVGLGKCHRSNPFDGLEIALLTVAALGTRGSMFVRMGNIFTGLEGPQSGNETAVNTA